MRHRVRSPPHRALKTITTGTNPVHVLLTDIVMPDMDGTALVRAVREAGRLTQVIVMTAYSSPARILEVYRLGALDYLVKPFESLNEVVEVVRCAESRFRRWQRAVAQSVEGFTP